MSFDFVAPVYDWLARLAFGQSLLRAQRWGIDQLPAGATVLLLGGGTGATLPHLLTRQPTHIWYVEASAAMVRRARRRVPVVAPVTFIVGTEATSSQSVRFDYILLPFVLDLYPVETLRQVMIPALLRQLSPAGVLIVTDFDQPRTYWQRAYMWSMLRFFQLTARIVVSRWTNWPQALQQAGLVETTSQLFRAGQVRSGCWVWHGARPEPTR